MKFILVLTDWVDNNKKSILFRPEGFAYASGRFHISADREAN